jgi:transposase-like protein
MQRRKFTPELKLEAVRLIRDRGVFYAQASRDLSVHVSLLRKWVKACSDDPQHAFPGNGQMNRSSWRSRGLSAKCSSSKPSGTS